tara:strand:+ start:975 stop:1196 length:222 start_codon:yes stop_codon:yes gene_type:complete
MNKANPFDEPLERTYEYCTTCKAKHSMLDGGDIYDCMIYYRFNVESAETKALRESKVEVYNIQTKTWSKKQAT